MAKKSKKQAESNFEAVEGALTRSEMWLERNSKKITIVVGIVVVVVLGYLGKIQLYDKPNTEEAQNKMFMAEKFFEQGDYQKALDGDEKYAGFLEIVNDYSSTKPGKLAAYYAGLSYLNLGEFEQAITYLKKYTTKDAFFSIFAEGAIGDANLELGRLQEAMTHYKKAAEMNPNDVTTPTFLFKLGQCQEMDNNLQEALNIYEKIRIDYPNSNEAREMEKYIERIKAEMAN